MIDHPELPADRYFSADPATRDLARELHDGVRHLPLVSPHGHVPPALLADPDARLGSPAEVFVIPDHYVFRMLHSRGTALADLGVPARDGRPVETDHRLIWQRFAEGFDLFAGTPSGLWLRDTLAGVFGITGPLNGATAGEVYDQLEAALARPELRPRALFARFGLEVLCTTDPATSPLDEHRSLAGEGWGARVRPTFRPDALLALDGPDWAKQVGELAALTDTEIDSFGAFLVALATRREEFARLGAVATDHSVTVPRTELLDPATTQAIFARALRGTPEPGDADRFTAHMLIELARMSADDGLVMQLHAGSLRNHDAGTLRAHGPDAGADIPVATEWTRNLRALLGEVGHAPAFRLVLSTLDESTYSRELAPLAGFYPSVMLGPPWWFHDSPNGIRRYLDAVAETAGLANLVGFHDDTRSFVSIPARHDLWRRVCCDWLAGLVRTGRLDRAAAPGLARHLAHDAARSAYRLDGNPENWMEQ